MIRKGFWAELPKPFFVLAPMADVTDAAFRRLIAKYSKYGGQDIGTGTREDLPAETPTRQSSGGPASPGQGGPSVMWTEFVSCDGLCSPGRPKLLPDLWFTDAERPIVAQFFGATPEHFYTCALLAQELGFDGIDINMGCPDRSVEKQGAGAALIKNPKLAQEIIRETQRGAGPLPVSVKTRIGYATNELVSWLPYLLETEPAAVTLHARTRNEMSDVPARWDAVAEAVAITEKYFPTGERPFIIGNGDVMTLSEGASRIEETRCDGVMFGRAIFGNPWLFAPDKSRSVEERLGVMIEHTKLFEELFTGKKNFDVMKKHYKAYVSGFDGAKELRIELMGAQNAAEVEKIVLVRYPGLHATAPSLSPYI